MKRKLALLPLLISMNNALAQDGSQTQIDEIESDVVEETTNKSDTLEDIYVTAEEQGKQSLGVSIIDQKQIENRPAANDISEIVRMMPGVNLTGNTTSGQRGNNRQIDIRGMGPENTLILIDGKPVTSRNSVRYSWRGQRDTRGDSNWVPVEEIESIEVIRGPAAARYGTGAAGGVVNIKTKGVPDKLHRSINYYTNQPSSDDEGATNRVGFNLSGPINENLGFRLYGSANKTDSDSTDINVSEVESEGRLAAGREGVRNRDIAGRLYWKISPQQSLTFDSNFSRQGNIYTGDTQHNLPTDLTEELANSGSETNTLYRRSYSLTHDAEWAWGNTQLIGQYDFTSNRRLLEGLAGGPEGRIVSNEYATSRLKSYRLSGEANVPVHLWREQILTTGFEWNHDKLTDPGSMSTGNAAELGADDRSDKSDQTLISMFVEDNIYVNDALIVTPSLMFNHSDISGSNWSPGINLSQGVGDYFTIKGGIAQAYKAPNLYQSNSGYLLRSRGNGCPIDTADSCYLMGNSNLDAEQSINKEFGVEFEYNGWNASIAWFRNDYKDKIEAGDEVIGQTSNGYNVLQWTNIDKAVVEGYEGNLTIPVTEQITWTNNFTYMKQSENKETGNPLSIIPKYTINSIVDWQINDRFSINFIMTHYGHQDPREYAVNRVEVSNGINGDKLGGYTLFGASMRYDFSKTAWAKVGVSNLFDKEIKRSSDGNDANSYNEPGRAFYASFSAAF